MVQIYLKQGWSLLKQNRLVSMLSIAGTALSVSAIMLVVLVCQVNYADYAPENNRFRTLYLEGFCAIKKEGGNNRGRMSTRVLQELLYQLKTPEAVTAIVSARQSVGLPGQKLTRSSQVKYVDPAFWRFFDFTFLSGAPFTQTDFDAPLHRAVLSESTARKLFGTTDAVGRTLRIAYQDYAVCGVVKDVTNAARVAYAQVWVPYTVNKEAMRVNAKELEGTCGMFDAYLLARSSDDFPAIRKELDKELARFNYSL